MATIKKLIIKLIVVILFLTTAITTVILIRNLNNDNNKASEYNVNVILVDIDKNIIDDRFIKTKETTLYELLNKNYKIRAEQSSYGMKLLDIENIKTDFKTTYIAIYVDGKFSTKGMSFIIINKDMKIELKEIKI